MHSIAGDGTAAGVSASRSRRPATGAARAKGGARRKANNVPALPGERTDRPSQGQILPLRLRTGFQTIEATHAEPERVESLEMYMPCSKNYQVSLAFSGEAGAVMRELMTKLSVDNPNDVVRRTLALLLSAQGKEILLRDPKTGIVEVVEV